MLILADVESLSRVVDPTLRNLLQIRVHEVEQYIKYGRLSELITFIVVEPGEPLCIVEKHLGFSLLQDPITGTRFGEVGFSPSFELIVDHPTWYEIVFIWSDGDEGVEVFVPKHHGVDATLLAMCAKYALRLDGGPTD